VKIRGPFHSPSIRVGKRSFKGQDTGRVPGHRVEVVPAKEVARAVDVMEGTRATAVEQRRVYLKLMGT